MKHLLALCAALVTALAFAGAAAAEQRTLTFTTAPITVSGYQVKQSDYDTKIPRPDVDGFITGMEVDVVDKDGRPVPISRLMLHHIVFSAVGQRSSTCSEFTLLDSRTKVPGAAEQFFAAGEERSKLTLPPGYGYPVEARRPWAMTWMLMNHRAQEDTAYIQYKVTYDTAPDLTPVKPYWLDVRNCRADPVFDVPGDGPEGSTWSTSSTATLQESGYVVAGGGHVHGGAKNLRISQPRCGDRALYTSRPTWGLPSHPFYNVAPVLHEPGPIDMSGFTSQRGIAVRAGEQLKLTATYDNTRPHTRAMGISLVYMAPNEAAGADECDALPGDMRDYRTSLPGRTDAPTFRVPLTGIDDGGRARRIAHPPGATTRVNGSTSVAVGDNYFSVPNLSVPAGSRVRWRFDGSQLHNVTIADGPRGFSSNHLDDGRTYSQRLDKPGTYKLFCALHPVDMTETVTVRPRRRR